MFRTWHHGHSLGAGVLAGLLLGSRRPELVFAAGLLVGAVTVLVSRLAVRLGRLAGDWLDRHSDRTTVHLTGRSFRRVK
jgi:hypothetical protein